jgi:acyl-[acyl-carrier-protein]-phospholipid O-acyltransferase/long-chain-fatty-acid--[acyl-carrier-protein] ligase
MRGLLVFLLRLVFRIEVKGLEHYHSAGERVLIVANHLSFLDALLIALFLPRKPLFAINTHIATIWYIKPFLKWVDTFPLDPTNPLATKAMIARLKQGAHCVIFPEGRITVTGSLMKVYEGPGMIADKADAQILPIRIDGAQYTPFSRLKGKVRIRWFPKITLQMLPPQQFTVNSELKGRKRRAAIGNQLYDTMTEMLFATSPIAQTLWHGLCDAHRIHGDNHLIIEDVKRQPLTYLQVITRSLILGKKIAAITQKGEFVGILLPNMSNTIITFFALQAFGRVAAMLNFSTGSHNVVSACHTTELKQVFTSRQFIETAKLHDLAQAITESGVSLHYLEDMARSLTLADKCNGFLRALFAPDNLREQAKPNDAAVILFTSGSEGVPKGVVLSHQNIQANRYQLASRVDFGSTDIVFNALPVFHSFGLTGGTLLPLLSGIRTFFYPSPLHYRIIPELVYDSNATILFGTDTFLSGYARFAHSYDFYAVRYVFAGAEKLKEETRRIWSEKYGVRILEGYGATETSPVIATNTPMQNRIGTVGRLMPAMRYQLEPVAGINEGGKLWVQGPNIMKGYLLAGNKGILVPPAEGWYDTGDIVSIDAQGFITIKGRAKRFAKIGGEMISLTAVENYLAHLWPESAHAVVSLPDERKGEQLILLTEESTAERSALLAYIKTHGISELSLPKTIHIVPKLPLLGTGKLDYVSIKQIALEFQSL